MRIYLVIFSQAPETSWGELAGLVTAISDIVMALGVAFEPYFDPTMAVLTTVYQKFRATPGMVGEEEEVELLRAFLDTMTAFCQFYGRDRQGCMSPFMVMIAELCNSVVLLICATGPVVLVAGKTRFGRMGTPLWSTPLLDYCCTHITAFSGFVKPFLLLRLSLQRCGLLRSKDCMATTIQHVNPMGETTSRVDAALGRR